MLADRFLFMPSAAAHRLRHKVDIQSYAVRNRLSIWFFRVSPCRNGGLDTLRFRLGEHFDSVFDQFGRVDVWSILLMTILPSRRLFDQSE